MKIIYYNCGVKIEILRRSLQFSCDQVKPEKKEEGMYRIRTHNLCGAGAAI